MANSNNSIQILQNQIVTDTIIKFSNHSHLTCVHRFVAENDIFELKSQGSGEVSEFLFFSILNHYHKATISMKIINEGIPTKLKFGKNRDLDSIRISSTNATCDENFEIARTVLIRHGEIIESECVRSLLVLSTSQSSNIAKMFLYPGEHFI